MLKNLYRSGYRAFLQAGIASLAIVACSRQPELPLLPTYQSEQLTRRLALDENLDVQDWKELFRAINREKKLDALKPYVEDPPEAQLHALAELASKYVYEPGDKEGEFLDLLEVRAKSIAPTQLVADTKRLAEDPAYPGFGRAVLEAAANQHLPTLLSLSSGWFDDRLWGKIREARDRVQTLHPAISSGSYPPWLPGVVRDLGQLLSRDEPRADFENVLRQLRDYDLIVPIRRATAEARPKTPDGPNAIRGAAKGVRHLAELKRMAGDEPTTGLDLLFRFAYYADGPSEGIFETLSSKLTDLIAVFAPGLSQPVPDVVAASLQRYLSEGYLGEAPLSREKWLALARGDETVFLEVFRAARTAVDGVAPIPEAPPGRLDTMELTRNAYLTSYALARFVQQTASANEAVWKDPAHTKLFPKAVWHQPVAGVRVEIGIIDEEGKLDPKLMSDFERGSIEARAQTIKASFAGQMGPLSFVIEPPADPSSLSSRLNAAVHSLDTRISLARLESTLALAADALTSSGPGQKSVLAMLETPNLLSTFHDWLSGFSPELWDRFEHTLFVDGGLSELRFETQQHILGIFMENPELATKVARILETLPLIHEANSQIDGDPSLFQMYHRVVQLSDPTGLGSLLSFIGKHALFASSDPMELKTAEFPGFFSVARDTDGLQKGLEVFSELSTTTAFDIAQKFRTSLEARDAIEGTEIHVAFASSWLKDHADAVATWLESPRALGGLSDAELRWIRRFIENGDHLLLWEFFLQYGSLEKARALTKTLRHLADTGYLGEAFSALARFQNGRLQVLAARLQEWNRTKVLSAWFEAAEALLAPL